MRNAVVHQVEQLNRRATRMWIVVGHSAVMMT